VKFSKESVITTRAFLFFCHPISEKLGLRPIEVPQAREHKSLRGFVFLAITV
jgi:hypothetical protein